MKRGDCEERLSFVHETPTPAFRKLEASFVGVRLTQITCERVLRSNASVRPRLIENRADWGKPCGILLDEAVPDRVGRQFCVGLHPHLLKDASAIGTDRLDAKMNLRRNLGDSPAGSNGSQHLEFTV